MSHKNPEQIYRLIRTIKTLSPNSHILLSHNPTNCSLDLSVLKEFSGVDIQFATAERGDFSLIQKYFSAINWLLSNNIDFDWLINLSGQDYPTQPLSELELLLSTTQYDGFLQFFKVFSPESCWSIREGSIRYLYRYQKFSLSLPEWIISILKITKLVNYLQNFIIIHFSYGLRIGTRIKPIFNDNLSCYGGNFSYILSRKCVQFLNSFYQTKSHIIEYYKYTLLPDESFIQTVLVNSKKFKLSNECKHYSDFANTSHGHPEILTENHYYAMKQEKYFFARKFDIDVDSNILDILDQKLVRKTTETVS